MLCAVGEFTRDFGRAFKDRVFWLIPYAMLADLRRAFGLHGEIKVESVQWRKHMPVTAITVE